MYSKSLINSKIFVDVADRRRKAVLIKMIFSTEEEDIKRTNEPVLGIAREMYCYRKCKLVSFTGSNSLDYKHSLFDLS